MIIGVYGLSATVIIPRFGAASFIAYILIAQLVTSAVVDQRIRQRLLAQEKA